MISEKLKLQKGQLFVDRFLRNSNELEKVFLPTRFILAYAGKHISILLWYHLIFKGKSKIIKSLLALAQKEKSDNLTLSKLLKVMYCGGKEYNWTSAGLCYIYVIFCEICVSALRFFYHILYIIINRKPQIPKFFSSDDHALFTEINFDYYNQIIIEKESRILKNLL